MPMRRDVTPLTKRGPAGGRDIHHRRRAAPGLGSDHARGSADIRPYPFKAASLEALMKKLYFAATALFLASTAVAHAGNSIAFEIEGQKIRIETPRNCA